VWTSADAETWAQAGEDQLGPSGDPEQMNGVAAAGGSLVAGGWAEAAAGRDAALWSASLTSP
jgi:hypothetical protein